jgi:hypothetical protein
MKVRRCAQVFKHSTPQITTEFPESIERTREQATGSTVGGRLVVHVGAFIYIMTADKRASSRKRNTIFIVGNFLILLLFYVPTRVAPERYLLLY